VANALDREQLRNLIEEHALATDEMDVSRVYRIREEMECAEARRLQPHYIESFFLEAFQRLGGTAKQREARRYEIPHVPSPVRNRDRLIGIGEPVLPRYERIAFEKTLIAPDGQRNGLCFDYRWNPCGITVLAVEGRGNHVCNSKATWPSNLSCTISTTAHVWFLAIRNAATKRRASYISQSRSLFEGQGCSASGPSMPTSMDE